MNFEHGGNIYRGRYDLDFSANINPLGMPVSVAQAACRGVRMSTAYPDPDQTELKKAISERENIGAGQIVCGNGAAEVIYMICRAVQPKRALLVAPGFSEYEAALAACGCGMSFYACREEDGFRPGEDYLCSLGEDTDIAFLCNPNNPTGAMTDPALLEKIVEKCRENRILLVADECFLELTPYMETHSVRKYAKDNPYLFILNAFTKLYAMAGLRLGYGMCADTALIERMRSTVQPWNVSLPAQMAGIAALGETAFVKDTRRLIAREREYLKERLSRLGLVCSPPAANFIFFKGPENLGRECAKRRILIRDCSNYRGLKQGYWRISVRTREENDRLLRVFEEILTQRG